MTFICPTCGESHDGLPDIGFRYPDYYLGIPEQQRPVRAECGTDLCRVDDDFFIRGLILLPVRAFDSDFGIGVWVSQKKENYEAYRRNSDTPDIGPFFGWLSNHLPFYEEETLLLKTMAHFQGNGQRPVIEPEPCEHQLYRDYANGITLEQAWRMVHWYDKGAG